MNYDVSYFTSALSLAMSLYCGIEAIGATKFSEQLSSNHYKAPEKT
jgi:hypothetical protein